MRLLLILVTVMIAGSLQAQNPLKSWARRSVPGFSQNLHDVAFGNGIFVAVGDGSSVLRSPDGINWAVTNAGSFGDLQKVRFLNGQFVAVGTSDKILFSTDGASWVVQTLPSANCWDVAYGNGVYVTAGSTAYVSSDTTNWATTYPTNAGQTITLDSVAFGNGIFIGTPSGGYGGLPPFRTQSVHSINGIDWTEDTAAPFGSGGSGDLVFGGNLFIGAGTIGSRGVYASTNGDNWCCGFYGQASSPTISCGLAFGQGTYIMAITSAPDPWSGYPLIYSSTNGFLWDEAFVPSLFPLNNDPTLKGRPQGAAFGNGTFIYVGLAGYIIQSGNVGGLPLISVQPQDRGAVVDNPATFSVQASGAPPLNYQWFHGATAVTSATNNSYSIQHVQAIDSGSYRVVITNSFGSVTSRVAQLSISFLEIKSYAGIQLLGVPGRTYRVEGTPANGSPSWQVLTNLVLPSSPYIWIDYASPQAGSRLYRAAELP